MHCEFLAATVTQPIIIQVVTTHAFSTDHYYILRATERADCSTSVIILHVSKAFTDRHTCILNKHNLSQLLIVTPQLPCVKYPHSGDSEMVYITISLTSQVICCIEFNSSPVQKKLNVVGHLYWQNGWNHLYYRYITSSKQQDAASSCKTHNRCA